MIVRIVNVRSEESGLYRMCLGSASRLEGVFDR